MKANVKLNDRVTLQIEEQKEMETLHKAIVLANYPKTCSKCKKQETFLASNKDKEGNTYIKVICGSCGASAKLGQYKVGGYFWHREFEIYTKGASSGQNAEQSDQGEDTPF